MGTIGRVPGVVRVDADAVIAAAGWVSEAEREGGRLRCALALAEGERDELLAERDRLVGLVGELRAELAASRATEARRLARLAGRPGPGRLGLWWGALCLWWWSDEAEAAPGWAWPSLAALAALAVAIVRW